ncbi:MAG TPA: hypothetical protein PLF79_14935 [Thauera sp.]|nr:hypothetical protein [Thauera sp.]
MTTSTLQRIGGRDRACADAASQRTGSLAESTCHDPLASWLGIASQASEMMLASVEVIGHRTGRMATAGPAPSADDLDEFSLMAQEKFEAATESSWSVTAHWLQLNQQLWTQMFAQMQAGMAAMMSAASSPNVAESMSHHAALIAALSPSADAHTQLSHAAADLARRALEPIHARATANAERLGRYAAGAA